MSQQARISRGARSVQLLRFVAVAAIFVVALYANWERQQHEPVDQPQRPSTPAATIPAQTTQRERDRPAEDQTAPRLTTTVAHQQIRDQEGRIIFRGDVELGPTLDRIQSGVRLDYAHDGAVFQNRERRLPSQPAGYYREYVHRTPGVSGPGPQRVVTGQAGEIYYTPDHCRTFQRLDEHD